MEIYPRSEFEYGILPCPLYKEGGDYHSVAYFNNWAHLWAIPQMTENDEYAERMMEIMAVYSSLPNSTMSAYYDRTVYLQAASNNGSRKVMDIIRTFCSNRDKTMIIVTHYPEELPDIIDKQFRLVRQS